MRQCASEYVSHFTVMIGASSDDKDIRLRGGFDILDPANASAPREKAAAETDDSDAI